MSGSPIAELSYLLLILLGVTGQANLAALVAAWQTQERYIRAMRVMASSAFHHRFAAWATKTIGTSIEREVASLIAIRTCIHIEHAFGTPVNSAGCDALRYLRGVVGAGGRSIVRSGRAISACVGLERSEIRIICS